MMRSALLLASLLLLPLGPTLRAATVTATTEDFSGTVEAFAVWTFTPRGGAVVEGPQVTTTRSIRVVGEQDGDLSTTLKEGTYDVTLNGSPIGWIAVPAGSGTYEIGDIGGWFSWLGSPFTFGQLRSDSTDTNALFLSSKLKAGSGISLAVTDTSGTNRQVEISATLAGTMTNVTLTAPEMHVVGSPLSGVGGTITLALTNDLKAVEAITGTGLAARTVDNTWTLRSVAAGSAKVTVANGSGVSGNPTVDLGTVAISDITGLQTELDGKQDTIGATSDVTLSNLTVLGGVTISGSGANKVDSLVVTNSLQLQNATASRFLVTDASGYVTNAAAATGTGAPVLQENPAITNITAIAGNVMVSMPVGFNWPQSISPTVWRNTNGIYSTPISAKQYNVPREKSVFVNAQFGSDSYDGLTPSTPKRGVSSAYVVAKAFTNCIIWFSPGVYNVASALTVTNNCSFICLGGTATFVLTSGRGGLSALLSSSDGGTNTYVISSYSATNAMDFKYPGVYGQPLKLSNVADLATCKVTFGSWVVDSGNTYITAIDNRKPDDDLITHGASGSIVDVNNANAYFKNIRFVGAGPRVLSLNTTNTVAFDSCEVSFSSGNGLTVTADHGLIISENTRINYSTLDGFNYHLKSTYVDFAFVEIDCNGSYNGLVSPDADNGSTLHDGIWGIRINGIYCGNGERNIHDIGDGGSWNLGCFTGYPFAEDKVNWAVGVTGSTKMWLDGCSVVGGGTTDALVWDASAALYWRSATMSTNGWVLSGTLTAY